MIRPERFLKRADVEIEADKVRHEFYEGGPSVVPLPVDPDSIAEGHCRLIIEWEVIEELRAMRVARERLRQSGLPGRSSMILAGLYPRSRRIVMNEAHADVFRGNSGLHRFTVAHEVGHWFLHIDHAQLNDTTLSLFGEDNNDTVSEGETIICRDGDDTWIERQANWFAASLLMPKSVVLEMTTTMHLLNWDTRYELAGRFGVSTTAMNNRLRELGVGDADDAKRLYNSPAERVGQLRLRQQTP